jgi:polysaccharide export outer membrane protein
LSFEWLTGCRGDVKDLARLAVGLALLGLWPAPSLARQTEAIAPPAAATPSIAIRGGGYRIGIGDRLDIQVVGRPQLTREALTVDSNGVIRMPYLKEPVMALCASEHELAAELERRYAEYLVEPQVSVAVRDFGSQSVELIGAVQKPGLFQLHREVRLRELLSIAGGVLPTASMFAQFVHDQNVPTCETTADGAVPRFEHETTVTSVDLTRLLRGESTNPVVRPGDFIHVPEADRVYVVGHVERPGPLPLNQRITISRAVAMAGGRKPDAKSEARLIRQNADGVSNSPVMVDLVAIERHGAPDIELLRGDVVEVPPSAGRQALKAVLAAALGAAFYYPLVFIR